MKADKNIDTQIIQLYNQGVTSSAAIARELNRLQCVVYSHMKKLGLSIEPRLKYEIDEDFFKHIDTEDKAWLLGLLYADGNVVKEAIQLELCDLEVIEKVKNILKYTGQIGVCERHPTPKSPYGRKTTYRINIRRVNMVKDLINKGCVPNKTFILKFPTKEVVPNHLIHHFIRGWFDGDGSVNCETKRTRWRIGFIGTREIIEGILTHCPLEGLLINKSKTNKNTWMFNIGKQSEVKKFINYIYQDAHIYMKRKHELSKKALAYIDRKENV